MAENKKNRKRLDFIPLCVILVALIFAVIIIGPDQFRSSPPRKPAEVSMRQRPTNTMTPTPTPLPTNYPRVPREFFENDEEMDGIIIGGTILIIIILLGIFFSKKHSQQK